MSDQNKGFKHIVISNHVIELNQMGRERAFKYAHINLLLYPDYYIVRSGTAADLYSCNNKRCITRIFLYWDNIKIYLGDEIKGFCEYVTKLEANGFKVEY